MNPTTDSIHKYITQILQTSQIMSKYCSFCKKNTDHFLKSNDGKTTCPVLLNTRCYRCTATGHTPKACTVNTPKECKLVFSKAFPKLYDSLEHFQSINGKTIPGCETKSEYIAMVAKTTPPAKTWASLAAKAPNESAARIIEESNKKLQQQVEESNKKRAEKKHQEYLERQEKRKEHEERQKRREQEQIQKNIETAMAQYGHRWFAYVYGTDLDCELAAQLRDQEDEEAYKHEEHLKELLRKSEEEYKHNKRTMTEEEFEEWIWEVDDEYTSLGLQQETQVCLMNNPAVTTYYSKTGIIHHPDDFVSRDAGAPLKPGLYRK